MSTSSTSNRADRIVKNTALLYFRSIVVMILAVYTSRVLLATLGVKDYGLYSVVGGIVAMFSSIQSVLAAAVQRFINFEKGKNDSVAVNDIFCSSIIIHCILATIFVIIIEPIGCWYINNKLVIPDGSLSNALFVFHCSVAATFVLLITIPYDSIIIANERMSFYAWVSLSSATFKLLIVFLLPILPYAYLKSYAILLLMVTVIHRLITIFYSKKFPETEFLLRVNMNKVKELGSFAGWNFLGCTASSLIEEGSNLILNAFGGVVANTARGLAYQVKSAVAHISNNVVTASRPFVTQQAAVVEKEQFFRYIHLQSKIVFLCTSLIVLPLYVFCEEVLSIWLKEVPPYAPQCVQSVLIYTVVLCFQKSIDLSFKSYGRIAKYQIVDSLLLLLTLPAAYTILKLGLPIHYVFYGFSIVRMIDYIGVLFLAKKELGMSLKNYYKEVVVPAFKACVIFVVLSFLFMTFCKANSIILLMVWIVVLLLISLSLIYVIVLNNDEKMLTQKFLYKILKKSRV